MKLGLTASGFEQVDDRFDKMESRAQNLTPAWNELADDFADIMNRNFATTGAVLGAKWLPLQSARYQAAKEQLYPGKPLMELSGDLKRSLTRRPLGVERINAQSMELGTDKPYARYHHRGIPKGTRMSFQVGGVWITIYGLPKRKLIGIPSATRSKWTSVIGNYILKGRS